MGERPDYLPGQGGWYSVPMDEAEARKLQAEAREWAGQDDTPNLYALYLVNAIDEVLHLRAATHNASQGRSSDG